MKLLLLCSVLVLSGCGYHLAGQADLIPKNDQTIAIPQFANVTVHYKITDWLPEAIAREFISRTRYHVVADPNSADLVLRGTVTNYLYFPTIFASGTATASEAEVRVYMQISLVERATGKVLYSRPSMEVRERYQISTVPSAFFEESDAGLARVSQQTARQVVSSILNAF